MLRPEGCHYSRHASRGGSVVLVEEAAELLAAADLGGGRSVAALDGFGEAQAGGPWGRSALSCPTSTRSTRSIAGGEDQQPVETLRANGANKPLGDSVRFGCPDRRAQNPLRKTSSNWPVYLLSRSRTRKPLGKEEAEVASLLGDPVGRVSSGHPGSRRTDRGLVNKPTAASRRLKCSRGRDTRHSR